MKRLILLVLPLILLAGVSFATWEDANGRGLIPYWQSVDQWYTLIVFVNGSEDNYDTLYIRFCDGHGNFCSDIHGDMFSIRPGEQETFSTCQGVGNWLPVTAIFGYIKFRAQDGGYIQAYTVIYSQLSAGGFVVPALEQDHGF
ncbi:MAG TPA: hypothetical protein VM163_14235 [bacterium]|nr:hypothetical protein [bacterium]